jgi:hypothetical protein
MLFFMFYWEHGVIIDIRGSRGQGHTTRPKTGNGCTDLYSATYPEEPAWQGAIYTCRFVFTSI